MADDPQIMVQPPPGGVPSPPTQGASQFAFALNPFEILITIGHSRVAMPVTGPGQQVVPHLFSEWFMTLALSPSSAMALSEGLKSVLTIYQEKFGKIPTDPNFSVTAEKQL